MARWTGIVAVLVLSLTVFGIQSLAAQSAETESPRKVVTKILPTYPPMARSLNLSGTVKLEALVLASGMAKTVQVKGGNPVLAQAAQNAVRGWKWEKSDHESTELLEFKFAP